LSRREVRQAFGIHRTTLRQWPLRQEKGRLADQPRSGRPRKIKCANETALLSQLQAMPDTTLEEHLVRCTKSRNDW
jgi:transposase